MIQTCALKTFSKGDIIIKQGDEGQAAYIIESGVVEILIEKDKGLIQSLGTRTVGGIVGEMALVDNKPRTATIKALEDCQLLRISRADFDHRLDATDPVINMIMQVILARYRDLIVRAHIMGDRKNVRALEQHETQLVKDTNALSELKILDELKVALENNQFELHYQPILDLKTKRTSGLEALIRWRHPERGLIFPDHFIGAAENSGLITNISQWVVEKSSQDLARLQNISQDSKNLFMSVNFTAKDFEVLDFKDHILKTIKNNNLQPQDIHIEITERLLMDNPLEAQRVLENCRDAGMIVSIDDFGTGFSSLNYLHHFPIDILKIDRSFVAALNEEKSTQKLVNSIVALAHNLDMSIIAEGIEDQEHADILEKMGCDKAQGYFFSKPVPLKDIENYLTHNT